MNNEVHFLNSRNFLDLAKEKLDAGELDGAIVALRSSCCHVMELLEHAKRMKREKVLDEQRPGMNTR